MFNVSSDFKNAVLQSTRTVKASIGIGNRSVQNMIQNGNFTSASNWTPVNCTATIGDGVMQFTATAQYGQVMQSVSVTAGCKYYVCARVDAASPNITVGMQKAVSPYTTLVNEFYLSGVNELVSGIGTATETALYNAKIADNGTGAWTSVYVKEFIVINLTSAFGIGSEPSKEYMDELISKVGWFGGIKNLPDVFLENRRINNAVSNGNFNGITGWTSANGTISAASNVLTLTAGSSSSAFYASASINTTERANKWYMRAVFKLNDITGVNFVRMQMNDGAVEIASHNVPVTAINTWVTASAYVTTSGSSTSNGLARLYCSTTSTTAASTKVMNVKEVVVINLTELYGIGKEPTKAVMDAMITGWFQSRYQLQFETGDQTLISDFSVQSSTGGGDLPTVGGVFSSRLNLKLINDARIPQAIVGVPIRPYVAIDVSGGNGVYEWVRQGEFYATYSGVNKGKLSTTIEAFDIMSTYDDIEYATSLSFPNTITNVISDLETNYGVRFDKNILTSTNLLSTDFDGGWEYGHYSAATGEKEPFEGRLRMVDLVPVNSNATYYVHTNSTGQSYTLTATIRCYDSNKNFISSIGGVSNSNLFTTAVGTKYISVSMYANTGALPTYEEYRTIFTNAQVKPFICASSVVTKTFNENKGLIKFISAPTGSIRNVMSQIASLMTTNAVVSEDGVVKFLGFTDVNFSLDKNNYIDFKQSTDSAVKISQLQVKVGKDTLSKGTSDGYALMLDCKAIISQCGLNAVYNRAFPFTYYAYTMRSQGMPHLQVGDIISLTYLKLDGTTSTIFIPIITHKLTFNGGLKSEFKASAPKDSKTDLNNNVGSTVAKAVEQSYADLISAMNDALQIISGNEGGYVLTVLDGNGKPTELVIADSPDISTAKNLWRWNKGGLFFSDQGYTPTVDGLKVALTSDGQINAEMMTTGTLTANLVKAGVLMDVAKQSWIDMNNGTFSFGGGKIAWDGTTFSLDYNSTSLKSDLDKKADDTDLDGMRTYMTFGQNGMVIGKTGSPQQISIDNTSVQFLDTSNGKELTITALSGNGTAITVTYAAQPTAPYPVGTWVEVKDCVPTAYNGIYKVTACTTTSVTLTGTATGTATTLGVAKFGFMADPNAVAWINGQKMYIKDVIATNSMTVGNHQIYKNDSNVTIIKYVG